MSAANATAPPMPLPVVDTGVSVLTTLGYLFLLLAVIFLAYYLLKRFGFHGLGIQGGPGAPSLVSRLMLGQRQSVVVVRYRDADLVLGVTEDRITLLKECDAADDVPLDEIKPGGFAALLKRSMGNEG